MERRDAIKALARAGKYKDALELIGQHGRTAQARFEEIRADRTRTEEWRRWALARNSAHEISRLDAELSRRAERVVSTDRTDASSVFGVLGINGDEASKSISRRDAGDRVAAITDGGELRALLARATRSGDEILARAVAERALEISDNTTLEQFIADRPEKEAAVVRLWDAERASDNTMEVTMAVMDLLPAEVKSFRDIEASAWQDEPGAPEPDAAETRLASHLAPILQNVESSY